jgi:hypothetical protein
MNIIKNPKETWDMILVALKFVSNYITQITLASKKETFDATKDI